jgi:hypothetical protein
MTEVPSLAALGEPCDNFANCLDPEFGASNGDPRADDEKPFQCATYSFCPGKYMDINNLLLFMLTSPMKIGQCSETSAYKIQTRGITQKKSIQHSEHGNSLKSRIIKKVKVTLVQAVRPIGGVEV